MTGGHPDPWHCKPEPEQAEVRAADNEHLREEPTDCMDYFHCRIPSPTMAAYTNLSVSPRVNSKGPVVNIKR